MLLQQDDRLLTRSYRARVRRVDLEVEPVQRLCLVECL